MVRRKTIGILGGTFDPIHFGHLRAAIEIRDLVKIDELRIIPCRFPPHRGAPIAEATHRLNMVKLAVMGTSLIADDREIQREGPSYMVDTLMSLRKSFPKASLCMIVGLDAFISLPSWCQWEKIIQLANIIVMHRVGFNLPEKGIINEFLARYGLQEGEEVHSFSAGRIARFSITELDISASQIRLLIQSGFEPEFLLPHSVWNYIQTYELYGYHRKSHSSTQSKEVTGL